MYSKGISSVYICMLYVCEIPLFLHSLQSYVTHFKILMLMTYRKTKGHSI
jgi:hypothetical protein